MNLVDVLLGPARTQSGPDESARSPERRALERLARLCGPGSIPLAVVIVGYVVVAEPFTPTPIPLVTAVGAGSAVVLAAYLPRIAMLVVAVLDVWLVMVGFSGAFDGAPAWTVATVVCGYAIGREYGWISGVAAITGLGAAVVIVQVINPEIDNATTPLVVLIGLAGLVVLVGHLTLRFGPSEELDRVRRESTRERDQRRLLEERARIAREMHDVVAHHMSVIAVQASTAEYRLGGLPEPTRAEFDSIAVAARASLAEMRRLLGMLRQEDGGGGEGGERAPQPGLGQIEALAEGARRAGIAVASSVPEDLEGVTAIVSLTAYRIVQEALSNVVRHAPGARATVEVSRDDSRLVVLVINDRPASDARAASAGPSAADATEGSGDAGEDLAGGGLGLAGMRDRVGAVGGELIAEDLGPAGFVVKARLPLIAAPSHPAARKTGAGDTAGTGARSGPVS